MALTRGTAALADARRHACPAPSPPTSPTLHRRQHTVLRSDVAGRGVPADRPRRSTVRRPPRRGTADGHVRRRAPRDGRAGGAGGGRGARPRRPPRVRGGRRTTCAPPSRRCTLSGTPRRRCCAAARRPCPSTRSAATRWARWRPRTSAAVYFLEVVGARVHRAAAGQVRRHPRRAARPARRPAGGRCPARRLARAPAAVPGRRRRGRGPPGPRRRSPRCAPPTASTSARSWPPTAAAGLAALTRWLGTVEVEAHRWGVDLEPFPGLHVSAPAVPVIPAAWLAWIARPARRGRADRRRLGATGAAPAR